VNRRICIWSATLAVRCPRRTKSALGALHGAGGRTRARRQIRTVQQRLHANRWSSQWSRSRVARSVRRRLLDWERPRQRPCATVTKLAGRQPGSASPEARPCRPRSAGTACGRCLTCRLPPQPAAAQPRPAERRYDWLPRAGTLRSRLARGPPEAVHGHRHETSTSPPPPIIRLPFAPRYRDRSGQSTPPARGRGRGDHGDRRRGGQGFATPVLARGVSSPVDTARHGEI
jgi:hypothetical protein